MQMPAQQSITNTARKLPENVLCELKRASVGDIPNSGIRGAIKSFAFLGDKKYNPDGYAKFVLLKELNVDDSLIRRYLSPGGLNGHKRVPKVEVQNLAESILLVNHYYEKPATSAVDSIAADEIFGQAAENTYGLNI